MYYKECRQYFHDQQHNREEVYTQLDQINTSRTAAITPPTRITEIHRHNSSADERRALLVAEGDAAARAQAEGTLDDPDEREDGEDERGPVHEARRGLVCEDGPERPGDGDRSGEGA